jgi:hypothetical protein
MPVLLASIRPDVVEHRVSARVDRLAVDRLVARSRRTMVYSFVTRNQEPPMARDPAARAPRGTRTVAQAFFQAVEEIPVDRRADVTKAALSLIRDQIKEAREKARAAKQKRTGTKPPARKATPRKQATRAASPVPAGSRPDETTQEENDA